MTADIRALAEAWKDGGNPIIDRMARYILAVEDALDRADFLKAAMLESFHHDDMGADMAKSIRAAIARNLERK